MKQVNIFKTSFSSEFKQCTWTSCKRLHNHSRKRLVPYQAPGDRTEDPTSVQGHRCALNQVDLGKPKLLPNRPKLQNSFTVVLHLHSKLKMICRKLKASSKPCPTSTLSFARNFSAELRHWGKQKHKCEKAKRIGNNNKYTKHSLACSLSLSPHYNVSSCELKAYLPCATIIPLKSSRILPTGAFEKY